LLECAFEGHLRTDFCPPRMLSFYRTPPSEEGRGGWRPGIWKFHTMSFHTTHSIVPFYRVARPLRRSHHHEGSA
jgi:hypothetical protein